MRLENSCGFAAYFHRFRDSFRVEQRQNNGIFVAALFDFCAGLLHFGNLGLKLGDVSRAQNDVNVRIFSFMLSATPSCCGMQPTTASIRSGLRFSPLCHADVAERAAFCSVTDAASVEHDYVRVFPFGTVGIAHFSSIPAIFRFRERSFDSRKC